MIPFLFPFSRGLLFPLVALDKISQILLIYYHASGLNLGSSKDRRCINEWACILVIKKAL